MAIPRGPVPSFPGTVGLQDGRALNRIAGLLGSTQNNVTAKAGGAKIGATPITGVKVQVVTVANVADSVLLPPGYPGLTVTIFNKPANAIQVFGYGNDIINSAVTATGVDQAGGKTAIYTCHDVVAGVGQWSQLLSA